MDRSPVNLLPKIIAKKVFCQIKDRLNRQLLILNVILLIPNAILYIFDIFPKY